MLLISAVFALWPVVALAGDEQPAGEQDAENQSVGVAFEWVSNQLVEEQDSQHDQQQQEVGHVLGPARHQGQDHSAAHFQGADDLAEQHRADPDLLQTWQCLGIALIGSFLK